MGGGREERWWWWQQQQLGWRIVVEADHCHTLKGMAKSPLPLVSVPPPPAPPPHYQPSAGQNI